MVTRGTSYRPEAAPWGAPGDYETGHDHLDLDDVLLLYTDGIIGRPHRAPEQATVDLLTTSADAAAGRAFTVNAAPRPAQRVTEQVMELLTRIAGYTDDITLFAAQRRAPIGAFTRTGPAVAEVVARWRSEFDGRLRALAPEAVVMIGVQHAVLELTTNAVEHAYRDSTPGELTLTATLTPTGDLEISVRVSGPIDISTARAFDSSLRDASRHAISSLTVDLSDVTHLASAGIQVLAEALRRSADRLVLFAPPGSPAQHVLALTQLPHNSATRTPPRPISGEAILSVAACGCRSVLGPRRVACGGWSVSSA